QHLLNPPAIALGDRAALGEKSLAGGVGQSDSQRPRESLVGILIVAGCAAVANQLPAAGIIGVGLPSEADPALRACRLRIAHFLVERDFSAPDHRDAARHRRREIRDLTDSA